MNNRNVFYIKYSQRLMVLLMIAFLAMLLACAFVLYEVFHRPEPLITAVTPKGQRMNLHIHDSPNILPGTIIEWAQKTAVAAYTFDFVNYNEQTEDARPFFTPSGWVDYQNSIDKLISTITQNQLFVNGVVSGATVISNEGPLPGKGYVWRVQVPFLVTYQSAEKTTKQHFTVVMNIVRVPTSINPSSIGVDQFVMY